MTASRRLDLLLPKSIDFTHGRYLCIDGLYYTYLLVPSDGYKTQVPAGWLSLIVNAGDGIDLDMFLSRQPKERIIQRVGQQLRINRSKIKDASDTNTDFDDIDGAIRSGYFLKEGLANNEDFYYLNLLITVTAPSVEDLEWKASEIKKAPAFAGYGCLQLPFSGGAGILFCPPAGFHGKGTVRAW